MQNLEQINTAIVNATCAIHPDSNAVIQSMLNREIQSTIGYRSEIKVECVNGVVTLSCFFSNEYDKNNALRKAISNPCVRKVINNAN